MCAAPAMLGNTIVWKAAETQIYSAQVIMEIFEAAGLPPGVINLVHVDGPVVRVCGPTEDHRYAFLGTLATDAVDYITLAQIYRTKLRPEEKNSSRTKEPYR